ncbi:MAG: tetratricopeptide repeat protein [Verrucomicrobiales bacterium]|nr:tetratricopeptide repeat protein [Verrucomicrobiales bacterium]
MKTINANDPHTKPETGFSARFGWLLALGCVLSLILGSLRVPRHHDQVPEPTSEDTLSNAPAALSAGPEGSRRLPDPTSFDPAPTAEEIVAGKLQQFTRSRRELAREMARRKGVAVPDDVEHFFNALESGKWEEIDRQWKMLAKTSRQYNDSTDDDSPKLDPVWSAVLDAYGVAEQVHEWPAQKLLDYGNAILDSLRPGMVYVGGTDYGRWIPTLLNETSGRDPHIIVTQNALADGRYVEYMSTLYGDRFATLTEADSQRAFSEYVTDARRRLEHDLQFPDEPKQLRAGEEVTMVDGKVQVGGQIAVMSINENLLQALMAKNPDLDFALQESSPLRSTYPGARPLGPLMELGAQADQNGFTPEQAAQSLDYWRNRAEQAFSDPEAIHSEYALKSYSHDTVSAANLLAAHNFTAEAEEAYRLASQLWPGNPESVAGLADSLVRNGRVNEARQLVSEFEQRYPDQGSGLRRMAQQHGW